MPRISGTPKVLNNRFLVKIRHLLIQTINLHEGMPDQDKTLSLSSKIMGVEICASKF